MGVRVGMKGRVGKEIDIEWVQGSSDEDLLVQSAIQVAIANPKSNPAALVQQLEAKVDGRLLREIERELHILDDSLDFALEFEGARKHIKEMYLQRSHSALLGEKSLSELTEVERQQLKSMSNSAAAKKR